MSLKNSRGRLAGKAEDSFRGAFERLKRDAPAVLPKGTTVSQNNVAREAGCDPSALKKNRFPSLIAEIQKWIDSHSTERPESVRQAALVQRKKNRTLSEKIKEVKIQRDHLASLLVEADAKILDLSMENARLAAQLPASKVTPIR